MKRKHDTLISSSQPAAKKKSLRRSMDGKSKKIIANASMTEPLETIKLEDISFEINQNLTPPSTPEKEPEIELPPETNGKQPKSYSEAKIPCTICSKEYKSVGNLNRHMKIHSKYSMGMDTTLSNVSVIFTIFFIFFTILFKILIVVAK